MAKRFTIIGVEQEEVMPIWEKMQKENEHKYQLTFNEGRFFVWAIREKQEKCVETFINALNAGLNLNIPMDAKFICPSEDQNFDFYMGFMFEQ